MLFNRRQALHIGGLLAATMAFPRISRAQSGGGTLRIAVPQSPSALEPVMRNNTSTLQTIFSMFDRLLSVDLNTGKVHPGLAESWKAESGTSFVFKLRPGVKFHDGSEMKADDVVFSFSKARTDGPPNGTTVAAQYHRTIAAVEALDDLTVRITTSAIDPAILLKLGGWATEIVSRVAFEAGDGWQSWARRPIATGPYKLVEHKQDERLVLEAHQDYWGGKPAFDKLEFIVVPEPVARANGLMAGDFDIATLLSPDQIDQINGTDGLEAVGGAIQNIRTLNFATKSGALRPAALRQAISVAIDREAIVKSIWEGRTSVPSGFQDPAYGDVFLPDVTAPHYDPDLARKLIAEARYSGEKITYRSQSAAYPLELQTSQVILEMLRDVGLNVELEVKENWDQVYQKPFESVIWNESTLIAWPDPSGGLIRQYGPTGQFQRDPFNWRNETFSAIAAEFQTSDDLAKRRELHRRLLDIVQTEDPPATVLFYNAIFYGKRKDVRWAPYPSLYADYGPGNPATKS